MSFLQSLRDQLDALAPELQALADDLAEANTETPAALLRLTDLVDELLAWDESAPLLEAASDLALQLLARWVSLRVGAIWASALDAPSRQRRRRALPAFLEAELQPQRLSGRADRLRQHAARTGPLLAGPGRPLRGRAVRALPAHLQG